MHAGRDPHVVAAHVEGLAELQVLRAAMEDDREFAEQFATVFDAAVEFYLAAIPLRALLLTDHLLGEAHRAVAGDLGLGPQLPVNEMAAWLESERDRGRIASAVDPQAAAMAVCGAADYVSTLHLVVDDATATRAYGDRDRLVAQLQSLLVGSSPRARVDD